jgi:lysozyme family protein
VADFQTALGLTLAHEGGYFQVAATGEVVNHGLTLATIRSLGLVKSTGPATLADIAFVKKLSVEDVTPIYRQEYWDRIELDGVTNQEIANKIFDLAVNVGCDQAVIFLQRAVGAKPDGDLGAITLMLTNRADPVALLAKIHQQAEAFYRQLAANNPALTPDLPGWLARLASA